MLVAQTLSNIVCCIFSSFPLFLFIYLYMYGMYIHDLPPGGTKGCCAMQYLLELWPTFYIILYWFFNLRIC